MTPQPVDATRPLVLTLARVFVYISAVLMLIALVLMWGKSATSYLKAVR